VKLSLSLSKSSDRGMFLVLSRREELLPTEVFAFSGIANPEGFYQTVEGAGFTITERHSFADHYQFLPFDVRQLREQAAGRPLLCTEKDLVRLLSSSHQGEKFDLQDVYYLPIELEIDREKEFFDLIGRGVVERLG
jgi:tetraacyldisaccharide 4'-kinase